MTVCAAEITFFWSFFSTLGMFGIMRKCNCVTAKLTHLTQPRHKNSSIENKKKKETRKKSKIQ